MINFKKYDYLGLDFCLSICLNVKHDNSEKRPDKAQ